MPDTIIENILNEKLDKTLLIRWLNKESIDDAPDDCILHCCKKSDFVAHFLTFLRNQTDSILQTNSSAVQIQNATPEKLLQKRTHHRSISEPTSDDRSESLTVKSDTRNHSPNQDKKKTGRRVKTKLFTDDRNTVSDDSRLSVGIEQLAISTPIKNGFKPEFPLTSPVTPKTFKDGYERCDTPRTNHRHSRSHEKSCLGDYLVTATKSSKKKKKNTSNDEAEKVELDLSNSEIFPEIGARKSSSLRSEKKRIKPTNIDKSQKSLSLNSFNMEFQQPPLALEDNSVFKVQCKIQTKELSNSFEVERNLLKQERHKLMEKFNILNTSAPKSKPMPQIRISQKESIEISQSYVKAEATKIIMKDKIDFLVEIYDILLKNNLILSINTELYFLVSILVSKQSENEYIDVESKLIDNNIDFLLRSIHNSTYFAVKSLWNQRAVLEIILDKNSLKTLGENKFIRSFTPELSKFVLNRYAVLGEAAPPRVLRPSVVTYNCDTDNGDNFDTTHSKHLFKKQRDMFYHIVRWYQSALSAGESRGTFRSRVKALLSGAGACNHAHLAALVIAHMMSGCLPGDAQESKLSKLQRRLTCPNTTESNRLPHFTPSEMFYKELISYAENESFRVHLKDALATEIITLDRSHLATDDRSANIDVTREFSQLTKKLGVLAKFLGYLISLPYALTNTEISNKNIQVPFKEQRFTQPREKVLENGISQRNYMQPPIDLKGLLKNATTNHRLSITLPWIAHYLSMLDYTALRLKYYNELTKTIYEIYSKLNDLTLKKNTLVYLKSILGWLFDLPHFPVNFEGSFIVGKDDSVGADSIDSFDLVDETTMLELCPCLRDINVLLSTCRMNKQQRDLGSFRHITPVSLSVNSEDRIKNKERELQNRLEEELIKSQPSSTRRVLELVVERVTSAAVKEFTTRDLPTARDKAREYIRRKIIAGEHLTVESAISLYTEQVLSLADSLSSSRGGTLSGRAGNAVAALVPSAHGTVLALAGKRATRAFGNWLAEHSTKEILCKDVEAEMRTLLSMCEMNIVPVEGSASPVDLSASDDVFEATNVSVAETIMYLKEHICLLLEDDNPTDIAQLLSQSATAVSPHNMFCRATSRRAVLQLTVDLAAVYVSKKPQDVTEAFLNLLHAIWNICCPDRKHNTPEELSLPERREISPQLRNFDDDERMATPVSDDDGEKDLDCVENQALCGLQQDGPTLQHAGSTLLQVGSMSQLMSSSLQHAGSNLQQVGSTLQPMSSSLQQIGSSMQQPSTSQAVTFLQQMTANTQIGTLQQTGSTSQQTVSTLQQTGSILQPTSTSKLQPTAKLQRITPTLQPINTKMKPIARSQPASPMYQPIVKWAPMTSKSQPVSPKLQQIGSKCAQFNPKCQQFSSKCQQFSPKCQQFSPKCQPFSPSLNESDVKNMDCSQFLECFDRILCPRNIILLCSSKCDRSDVWEAMATLLVFLLRNDYLSEDSLTEQCLAVYRQDWPQSILESLSVCMKSVSSRWARSSTGKFTLFLDFLSEYCGDMDYEPMD